MSDRPGGRPRSPSEIRAEIEATRARVAADIDDVRLRLSREGLQRDAMSALSRVRHQASGAMSGFASSTDRHASQWNQLAVDAVKRYPVITTLLGLGLAMLALNSGGRPDARVRERQDARTPTVTGTTADLPPPRH